MGKTLRKFSNKEKKTKKKRSYKKGGEADAWVDLRNTIKEELKKYEINVKGIGQSQNWNSGEVILERLYNKINKPKRSCRETRYFLNIKNEQCEAFKYLEYDLLRRYMIKQPSNLKESNNVKKFDLLYWIKKIEKLAESKMNNNRSKDQTINYLNSLTKEQTEETIGYFEFLSENLQSITNNIIKEEIMKIAEEQAEKERQEKEEQEKQQAENEEWLKKFKEDQRLHKIEKEKSIKQLVEEEGYIKLGEINERKFETNKDTYTYKMVNNDGKIFDLGRFKKLKEIQYHDMEPGMNNIGESIRDYVFEKDPPFGSSKGAIFYKKIDESTGGKKKYKKNRKTARRGRK
jgi:hypothetical protein